MSASCSPTWAPRALELKDSPRSQQSLQFIPASHMPKRQANSLPFQDSILHIPQTKTRAASSSSNTSRPTLRDVCDPMRRNIAYELEHSERLPDVYEEEEAIWTMGRDTAKLPGTPYLSSRHSKVKPWQGSPGTTGRNVELPPLNCQTAAEYRRRNLVKKLRTPFSHEHGMWDDLPLDLEAVAQAQKRGSSPSKRERVGRLILGLLERKESRNHRNKYQERGRERKASMDSYVINDSTGIPIPHSMGAIARTRSQEMRQQAIKLVGTIRMRKPSLQPGQLSGGQYEKSHLASLEPVPYTYHTRLDSDNSNPAPRGAHLQLIERRDTPPDRSVQNGEHANLPPHSMAVSSPSHRDWAMPGTCRSPSPVVGDSDSLVSGGDTDETRSPPVSNSLCSPQRLHRQPTTICIVVESEDRQIISKESYHIFCDPPVSSGSDVNHPPPANAVTEHVGDNGLGLATTMKIKHNPVTATSIPQTSSEARPTPTTSVTDKTEHETLTGSHMSPSVSSVTPGTVQSHTVAHAEALDCHQDYNGDCVTSPEIDWFRMGAHLRIPDRAAANDEYHRIKLQRIEQLKSMANRHRNPAYSKFKAEYRLRKQEEREEGRRIRSLAKQNAEAAMLFQVLEVESDLERRRVSSGSRNRSRVYRLPSSV